MMFSLDNKSPSRARNQKKGKTLEPTEKQDIWRKYKSRSWDYKRIQKFYKDRGSHVPSERRVKEWVKIFDKGGTVGTVGRPDFLSPERVKALGDTVTELAVQGQAPSPEKVKELMKGAIKQEREKKGVSGNFVKLTNKTVKKYAEGAGVGNYLARGKSKHRQVQEADLRNAISMGWAARTIMHVSDIIDENKEWYMPSNLKFNCDVTQWKVGNFGCSRTVCATKEALKRLRSQDKPLNTDEDPQQGEMSPFFVAEICLTNADGYIPATKEHVSGLVHVIKSDDREEGTITKIQVRGLSPYGSTESGQIWLVPSKHGADLKNIFTHYHKDIALPCIDVILDEMNQVWPRMDGKPHQGVFMVDGELEPLMAFQEHREEYKKRCIHGLKLCASCSGLFQANDLMTSFMDGRKLVKNNTLKGTGVDYLSLKSLERAIEKADHELPVNFKLTNKEKKQMHKLVEVLQPALMQIFERPKIKKGWRLSGMEVEDDKSGHISFEQMLLQIKNLEHNYSAQDIDQAKKMIAETNTPEWR